MIRLWCFVIAAITSSVIILALTYGAYASGLWAGGHAVIRDVVLRSLAALPVLIGLIAALWPGPKDRRGPLLAGIGGAAIGLAYAYFAIRLIFTMAVGRWGSAGHSVFLNWDLDVELLVCATAAGACALLLAVTSRSRAVAVTVLLLLILGVFAPEPLFNLVTHNQELTVAVVTEGSAANMPDKVITQSGIPPMDVERVRTNVLQSLEGAGIGRQYRVVDLFCQGHGKKVLAIIVIHQPIATRTELLEPMGADVIYLQEASGWKRIPPTVRTVNRSIYLWPPEGGKDHRFGTVMINDATGTGTGFAVLR